MKIIFIGGVKFSHEILSFMLKNDCNISAAFTYSDSKKSFFSDFKNFDNLSKKFQFKNVKVNNINDPENVELIKEINPDIILVMGWSQLLKREIISIPKFGVIGSHPTELPKYRGRAPIPWSILKGLKFSALTYFFIEEGIDDGDILDQRYFEIGNEDDASSIYDKVTELGKEMILSNLKKIEKNIFIRKKQNSDEFIENWPKRTPEDGKINWTKSAKEIHTLIRASTYPYPGAYTYYKNLKLIIWKASYSEKNHYESGKILDINEKFVKIGCRNGYVILEDVSLNEKSLSINQIFNKNDLGKIIS
ncbi:MAG: hypothetical protein CXT78_11740 [Thaumarchaeota archaeon]|jgi:methionyl-tRNA formyltransferase|nr:MAG: hypothetical protein CXT78_11740 [Nitrososphaerota archaeon]